MLSYALAIAVALSSLVLFSTAFLMSDIHRQDDFLWSGVGLFYALILWFCARNITGAVLLGQAAAVTLLVSYNWQTLKLRKAIANPAQASDISNFSILQALNGLLKRDKSKSQISTSKLTEQELAIPDTNKSEIAAQQSVNQSKSGIFGKLFAKKKATITNTKLDEILDKDADLTEQEPNNAAVKTPAASDKPSSQEENVEVTNANPAAETVVKEVIASPKEETSTDKKQELTTTTEIDQAEAEKIVPENPTPAANAETPVESSSETVEETPIIETNDQEEKSNISNITDVDESQKEEQTSASDSTTITAETSSTETEKTVSSLDSLETVEVAEVLEADPENISAQRESDQGNIIEVTTTEINHNTEDK